MASDRTSVLVPLDVSPVLVTRSQGVITEWSVRTFEFAAETQFPTVAPLFRLAKMEATITGAVNEMRVYPTKGSRIRRALRLLWREVAS